MVSRREIVGLVAVSSVYGSLWSGCAAPPPPPSPAAPPPPPKADVVLTGAVVHTLDPSRPSATAVALREGRIVAVGGADAVTGWIGGSTRVVQVAGHTIVPGLVDSHFHLIGVGHRRTELDLTNTTSLDAVLARVAEAAETTSPGRWIRGRGWDQNDWPDHQGFPSARDLDRVAPDNPVILTRIDGHAIWVNSAAMRAANITRGAASPAGGRIVERRGRPTGVFIDNASALVEGHVPAYTDVEIERAILAGQREALSAGLTQIHEMGIGPRELAALRRLDDAGRLRLRVYAMLDGSMEDLTPYMRAGPQVADGTGRLTVRGLKFYMDGALGSRGAALLAPYADAAKQTGLLLMPPELLEARVRTAMQHGFQVAVHAIGDRANRVVLDIFERVYGRDDGTHRPRIEHVQVLHPDDLPRLAELNVIASMQPTHATSDMPWAEERVGPDRIRTAYAWRSLLRSGAVVAAGSDAPVEDVSPMLGIYASITRKDLLGFPKSGWYPSERLTARQTLEAFSTAGAYASFREEDAGRIAVGRVADLTIIDEDPLTATEEELARMRAMMTIVGGRIEFERPGVEASPGATTSTTASS